MNGKYGLIYLFSLLAFFSCIRNPIKQKKKAVKNLSEIIAAYPDLIKEKDSTWSDTLKKKIVIKEEFEDHKKDSTFYAQYNLVKSPILKDSIFLKGDTIEKIIYVNVSKKLPTAEDLLDVIHIDTLNCIFRVDYKGNRQIVYIEGEQKEVVKTVVKTKIIPCPDPTWWESKKKMGLWVLLEDGPWIVLIAYALGWIVRKILF